MATEYGKCRIEEGGALTVSKRKTDRRRDGTAFGEEQPEMVIDATHPYAGSCVGKYPVCM